MKKCHDGKKPFPTLQAAQAAAAMLAKRKDRQGNTIVTFLRAYQCHCGKYHFGRTRDIDWSKVNAL